MSAEPSSFISRRDLILGSAAAAAASVGCGKDEPLPVAAKSVERRDVPIRVAIMTTSDADEDDFEALLSRAWSTVSDQSIKTQRLTFARAETDGLLERSLAACKQSDVVIYPLLLMTDLHRSDAIIAFTDEEFDLMDETSGKLLASVRNGAASYAGKPMAIPLGSSLPSIASIEPIDPIETWEAYDRQVDELWNGEASEPTADGWAGGMFLWRAARRQDWLFDRNSLEPTIETEPYVESLALMKQTHDRYSEGRQDPDQIRQGIESEKLRAAIGFDFADSPPGLSVIDAPRNDSTTQVLLDPFTTSISLSADCRQTGASKRFVRWICGGDGSATVRRKLFGTSVIRDAKSVASPIDTSSPAETVYESWLASRLKTVGTLPTLRILRAPDYYRVLDEQVGRVLDGDAEPKEALAHVAKHWRTLTGEIGVQRQISAWRRGQGMLG